MKKLLTTKFFVESLAGLPLLLIPSTVIFLVLGITLKSSGVLLAARFGGAILLALGIACWLLRSRSESRGAIRLAVVLLVYDFSVVALLLLARLVEHLSGIILWPAVVLHSGLAVWSWMCLRKTR
jgi:hypothetical protein